MMEPIRTRNSPADLLKTRMALEALKEELDGIEGTEEELNTISDHVFALESILKAKKPRVNFSIMTEEDVKKADVTRKRLIFDSAKVTELTEDLTTKAEAEIVDLHSRIKRIYARVNMDYERGSRMIIHAILLALAEIVSTRKRSVAILPETRIAERDGVQLSYPVSGDELWYVDYVVIEYKNVLDYKERLLASGFRKDAVEISKGRLFLVVEAKCKSIEQTFVSFIPEAVNQVIEFLKSTGLQQLENEKVTYYESTPQRLSRAVVEDSDLPLRKIVQLLREWLRPTKTDLFKLE